MNNSYTISQIGKKVGLPTKTIRYYEDIKLISPARRADNGYRRYTKTSVKELQLIKSARDLGIPIKNIKKLMAGSPKNCNHQKATVRQDIADLLQAVTKQLNQLHLLQKKLQTLQKKISTDGCQDSRADYCCNYLRQLVDIDVPKGGEGYDRRR